MLSVQRQKYFEGRLVQGLLKKHLRFLVLTKLTHISKQGTQIPFFHETQLKSNIKSPSNKLEYSNHMRFEISHHRPKLSAKCNLQSKHCRMEFRRKNESLCEKWKKRKTMPCKRSHNTTVGTRVTQFNQSASSMFVPAIGSCYGWLVKRYLHLHKFQYYTTLSWPAGLVWPTFTSFLSYNQPTR